MKRILIVTVLMVMTASLSLGQEMDMKIETKEKLIAMEKQAWKAWQDRDADFFKSFLADESVNVGAWGVTNKEQMLEEFGGEGCDVRSFSLDDFHLALHGSTAVLSYQAKQDATCEGNVLPSPVWSSSVYVKDGENWSALLYQETPAKN